MILVLNCLRTIKTDFKQVLDKKKSKTKPVVEIYLRLFLKVKYSTMVGKALIGNVVYSDSAFL
jgi:hypothetical protein